ncbi:MAG: DUF1385 domain-containing protein [Clostridiales bacterium]|nr:DUF1385 domain-containing protein [Clostridiales bacterium]
MKYSGIGGQAVIEGIMMKNKDKYAIAVRKPNQEIDIQIKEYKSISKNKFYLKVPILRGIINFVDSMVTGMQTLTYSASFFEEDEEIEKKKSKKIKKKKNDSKEKTEKMDNIIIGLTVAFSILASVAIFMILPYFISNLLRPYVISSAVMAIIEGFIRIAIFVSYIVLISQMKDIQRVFMYHGAEHKCINCIENGLELNLENVRISSKQHKRCGTSFLFIVMAISIIFFMFIQTTDPVLRVIIRLILIPIIAGVSYEFIRFAGRSESKIITILSQPGLWMQKLTTKEPDDGMIEVAIASVEAVFDWKEYLEMYDFEIIETEEAH